MPPGDATYDSLRTLIATRSDVKLNIHVHCHGRMKTVVDGKNLIVCPTASPYIRGAGKRCFEQYNAMIDAVLSWRIK